MYMFERGHDKELSQNAEKYEEVYLCGLETYDDVIARLR